MRTSTTIVEKFERWLASPGWGYFPMFWYPPMARSRPLAPAILRHHSGQRTDRVR